MFIPAHYEQVMKEVIATFHQQPLQAWPKASFAGAGIYALHYRGEHPLYAHMQAPVYVGKAVASGSRKGIFETNSADSALSRRLREHYRSLDSVKDIEVADFQVQYLILQGDLIAASESHLIREIKPIWNQYVDGFGLHRPGKNREQGIKSRWDTLHIGRSWAKHMQEHSMSREQIIQLIQNPK